MCSETMKTNNLGVAPHTWNWGIIFFLAQNIGTLFRKPIFSLLSTYYLNQLHLEIIYVFFHNFKAFVYELNPSIIDDIEPVTKKFYLVLGKLSKQHVAKTISKKQNIHLCLQGPQFVISSEKRNIYIASSNARKILTTTTLNNCDKS